MGCSREDFLLADGCVVPWFHSSCPVIPAHSDKYYGNTSGSHIDGNASRCSDKNHKLAHFSWPKHTSEDPSLISNVQNAKKKIKPLYFTDGKTCCPNTKLPVINLDIICLLTHIRRLAQFSFCSFFSSGNLIPLASMLTSIEYPALKQTYISIDLL